MKGVNKRAVAFCLVLLLLLSICTVIHSQPGFISLDCGGDGEYNDAQTIHWTSDQLYTVAGETKSIATSGVEQGEIQRPFKQLRYFPQGKRHCYDLPAVVGRKYIIRASLLYGNYDGLQSLPRFELLIDANHWDSVVINSTWDMITKEVIVLARRASISVCVGRSEEDYTPFISALELRIIDPSMYPAVTQDKSLLLLLRIDYGSLSNSSLRYPEDKFDRIWDFTEKSEDLLYINTTDYVDSATEFEIPSSVLSTALETSSSNRSNISSMMWSWNVEQPGDYFILVCFAEIQKLSPNAVREFTLSILGVQEYTILLTKYLNSLILYRTYEITKGGDINFSLDPTSRSTVGPVLNGGEIYQFSGLLITGTQTQDGRGCTCQHCKSAKSGERVTGDPCLPQKYSWDWVNCSQDSSPRIISVDLSGKGLNGSIPSSFGNLPALVKLNLARNTLTGPIPDSLANLPKLKELNLAENNLSGSVPTGLANKQRNGELVLSIDGNKNLCRPGTCNNTHKRHWNKALLVSLIIVVIATLQLYNVNQGAQTRKGLQKQGIDGC